MWNSETGKLQISVKLVAIMKIGALEENVLFENKNIVARIFFSTIKLTGLILHNYIVRAFTVSRSSI